MELLQPKKIRVFLKDGSWYDCPEANKKNVIRCIDSNIIRIEHYKPPSAAAPPKVVAPKVEGKNKESLLGGLLSDNKIGAPELIEWIEKSKSVEDIGIVMKGETRKTVRAAAKKRIGELL